MPRWSPKERGLQRRPEVAVAIRADAAESWEVVREGASRLRHHVLTVERCPRLRLPTVDTRARAGYLSHLLCRPPRMLQSRHPFDLAGDQWGHEQRRRLRAIPSATMP